ncbi:hypothetical protein TIFTF001_024590 [Ficus carica]|uniref:Uncharacterized protein n=1 Tax=Ficus carica TaxID=3494 RepID=A0AA88AVU9_FICCA|nr:hypothetical protein TIFTF001_024590 [Ficus carica]
MESHFDAIDGVEWRTGEAREGLVDAGNGVEGGRERERGREREDRDTAMRSRKDRL